MTRRLGLAGAALLMATLAVPACSPRAEKPAASEPKTATVEVSYDDLVNQKQISRTVELAVGDHLQVSLGSNASTGFQWEDKMLISDPKVITQTGHETVAPAADRPGAPGKEVWILQAVAPGDTTVSTTYGRPWPGGEKDSWVFTVNVKVS